MLILIFFFGKVCTMLFFGTIVVFNEYQEFIHRNFVGTTFKMIESIAMEFTNSEKEF